MEEQRPVPGQVQIKADEKELQGQYSNLVMLHHSVEEFTLNFIYIFPNGAQGKLLTSVIVSPGHAKRIWRALGENIARHEAQFGIYPLRQPRQGSLVAAVPRFQQTRDFSRGCADGQPVLPVAQKIYQNVAAFAVRFRLYQRKENKLSE